MPGGSPKAWESVKPIFQKISAQNDDGEPCCEWVGQGGAGHFVKMVHNGIEYGDMQMICETYQMMKEGLGFSNKEMHEVFIDWNTSELDSYLIEITRDILGYKDENGEAVVYADPNCQLQGTIQIDGYNIAYLQPINQQDTTIYLNKQEAHYSGVYTLTLYTKNQQGDPIGNIHVIVKDNLGITSSEGVSNTGGVIVLSDLESGNYTLQLNDNRAVPIYDSINNMSLSITDGNATRTVNLSTSITGYIKLKFINKYNSEALSNADISLKSVDSLIDEKYTDVNGNVIFTVSDMLVPYRVVANIDGFMITSTVVTPSETLPLLPLTIKIAKITPSTIARLNIRVFGEDGRAFKFVKVVLFDADNGFLTDYKPKTSNYDGNVIFPKIDFSKFKELDSQEYIDFIHKTYIKK
jgi:hypothetical protein